MFLFVLIGTALILLGAGVFYLFRSARHAPPAPSTQAPHVPAKKAYRQKRIGIITPLLNGTAYDLASGIASHVTHSPTTCYTITHYHGNNDRIALCKEASKSLKENDVVVSYGLAATNITFEAIDQLQSEVPLISAGLRPHHIPLIKKQNPDKILYGIISERNYLAQVKKLHAIKPSMKHVLIVHRQQTEWVCEEVKGLIEAFTTYSVEATPFILTHNGHIDNQMGAMSASFDTVFLMPRTLDAKGIQELITYCNLVHVTLCANELDPVILGAALGFGGEARALGAHLGHMVRSIIEAKKTPKADTLTEHVDTYHIALNERSLAQQDLVLNPAILFLLHQSNVKEQQQ